MAEASIGQVAGVGTAEDADVLARAFDAHYARLARLIARVTRDPAHAEELAVDLLLEWARHPAAHGDGAAAWLHRAAVRVGLDALRRQARRERLDRWLSWTSFASHPSPEQDDLAQRERRQVRAVLAGLPRRQAALLLLRSDGLTYQEIAAALGVKPASIGTLLGRAQRAFRKEYEARHGRTEPLR